jgi:hypothetical protein
MVLEWCWNVSSMLFPLHPQQIRSLKDLSKLRDHVRDSKVVILLQTHSVLTRPWCVAELVTTIQAGVPIIGVAINPRDWRRTTTIRPPISWYISCRLSTRRPTTR